MIDELKVILEALREEVKQNLNTINRNKEAIKLLKEASNDTEELRLQIKTLYNTNKTLILVNDANLKLQYGINQFIANQQEVINSNTASMKIQLPKKNGKIDFFKLTVNGEIPFNEYHPKFNDEKFIQQLLDYYIKNEEYEECSNIQRLKNQTQKV
jgi:hypothetical protein